MVKLTLMEQNETTKKYIAPRVIDALSSGFSILSKHIYLILFPIFLDTFLWLGPKLRLKALFEGGINTFFNTIEPFYQNSQGNIELLSLMETSVFDFLNTFNLFTISSTFPVGIPSLISGRNLLANPMGNIAQIEIQSGIHLLVFIIGLLFLGILLGTVYFQQISRANVKEAKGSHQEKPFLFYFVNILLYTTLITIIFSLGVVILLAFSSLISLLSPVIGQFVFLTTLVLLIWLFTPVIYAPAAIFLLNQTAITSLFSAYRIMGLQFRYPISKKEALYSLPKSVTFTLWALILYQGLNLLWQIPESTVWIYSIGIVGHSLISTVILTSGFQFFIKMNDWHEFLNLNLQQTSAITE